MQPTGAPEQYEAFKLPDGAALDEARITELTALARELQLPQAQAQRVVDAVAKAQLDQRASDIATHEAQVAKWAKDAQDDKEFGGAAFAENLAVAKKGLETFFPELKETLDQLGFGSHPHVIRGFLRIGKAIRPDGFVPGGPPAPPAPAAQSFYPNSNMNP